MSGCTPDMRSHSSFWHTGFIVMPGKVRILVKRGLSLIWRITSRGEEAWPGATELAPAAPLIHGQVRRCVVNG